MTHRMKSGERRAAIVASAIHLFAGKGFRGTTTRELASALGVTEPVLYQHFRTKKDLYTAIIENQAELAGESTARLLELSHGDDDRAFLTALGEVILDHFVESPDIIRLLLFSALERHELSDLFFDRLVSGYLRMVATYIRRRVRSGAFRKVSADLAARGLIGMFQYHGMIHLLHPNRFTRPNRKKIAGELVTLFLSGITASPRQD